MRIFTDRLHKEEFELVPLVYNFHQEFPSVPCCVGSVQHLCMRQVKITSILTLLHDEPIGIFESPKYYVNPQPNTRGIGPLVGRTSGNRHSVMHVLAVIFSITYHFFFICQYIFIQVILSGREIYPLLMYPSTFLVFQLTTKIRAQVRDWPL